MNSRIISVVALVILAGAACSRQGDESSRAGDPQAESPAPAAPVAALPKPEPPATLTDVNLVAGDVGGAVEELTDNYGPGFTGRRLIDGLLDPNWKIAPEFWYHDVPYPQEAVMSFFEREPALIGAITIVLPVQDQVTTAPKDVEVWTSMHSATERFTKVAVAALEARAGEQTVSFSAVEARYVKLRVLSGAKKMLEIAEVRVLEAARQGYVPLFTRADAVKYWKGSPREAAQRGLDWLQHAAPTYTCFACHVQGQVLMGQAVAQKHGYRVNLRSVRVLDEKTRERDTQGRWLSANPAAQVFGAMGGAYAADILGIASDKGMPGTPFAEGFLILSAEQLLKNQAQDGRMPLDYPEPPIIQGQFMMTANALVSISRAAAHSDDPKYRLAAERAVAWIASHEPQTTQDRIFKIIALMHYGTPDQKRTAWSVVEELAADQQADGGWKEVAAMKGSNAFATGQALYAFKQAGVSIHGTMFKRGVDFLLHSQVNEPIPENGTWQVVHTASQRPSVFAPTMWAVIGLAGSYGAEPTGALQIVKQQGDKPPSRNLEIVLDVSGSMNTKLGDSTRWKTALGVLKEVVDALPDDLNVGMRVYGHRHSSKSAQTCKDTELVVPIAKLDRERIVETAARLKPRGETPLIYSTLQTISDLKASGGGSVILITDGEESCKGDAKAAAAEIAASGVDVTLNIVGFTLTGEAVEKELGTLAGSTGGRYYGAQDGAQLSRAVKLAALQRLPYDILDASGKVLVSGQTSELSRELAPGKYRIRIDALGQVLEEPLTIVADETSIISLGVENDRFVIRR